MDGEGEGDDGGGAGEGVHDQRLWDGQEDPSQSGVGRVGCQGEKWRGASGLTLPMWQICGKFGNNWCCDLQSFSSDRETF